MRRSLEPAQLYTLLGLVAVGVPASAFLLLGTPELALPSAWSEARANISDGTYPTGAVVDVVSVVFLLAWLGSLWLLVSNLRKRGSATRDEEAGLVDRGDIEPPALDGQSGDEHLGIAAMSADITNDELFEPTRAPGTVIDDDDGHLEGLAPDAMPGNTAFEGETPGHTVSEDAALEDAAPEHAVSEGAVPENTVSDAEIVGHPPGPSPHEPPMIVPVRAYYFARAEDTLRSISAQFLQTPRRWEELRALNVASPGVAAAGPDTVLPLGAALALPGDPPLPWGKPDPVYLWTLAEKFLFTAWGREPTPEEVVPFWRGLTSGSQLGTGESFQPEHLTVPEFTSKAVTPPPPDADQIPPGEFHAAPPTKSPAPPYEPAPPPPPEHLPPLPAYEPPPPAYEPQPAAYEPQPEYEPPPAAYEPPPPRYEPPPPPYEPPPAAYEPQPEHQPPPPEHQPPPPAYEPQPAPVTPPAYQSPIPATHEPPLPVPTGPEHVDLGPIEPEAPYVEAEAPPMPTFMPSLMGADAAAPAAEAEAVASSNRSLAGTAIGDAMMLLQLSRIRRRRGEKPTPADPMEEALKQNARVDTLNLIEAAMRHLRAVTVGRLREKPAVLAVRVGTYGFEVLLSRPVEAPEGWHAASLGHVLELPEGATIDDLDAVGQGPSLCPALVPVGDTLEGPLLLNIEEIGCLIVSGPGSPSVNLLNAIVGTLGTSPLAGDIRIITVGMDVPAGLVGWEKVHSTSFDSPQLEELLTTAQTGSGASLDILVVGPGNDLLIQRAGQVAATTGSRLALVGATSSVAARWPWRIHVDETTTAVVHPIACTMAAAQVMAPAMPQLLSEAADPALAGFPRF